MGFWKCGLPFCCSNRKSGVKFRKFPANSALANLWREKLPNGFLVNDRTRLCELHFDSNQFERVPLQMHGVKKFKENAVPSLKLTCSVSPRKPLRDLSNISGITEQEIHVEEEMVCNVNIAGSSPVMSCSYAPEAGSRLSSDPASLEAAEALIILNCLNANDNQIHVQEEGVQSEGQNQYPNETTNHSMSQESSVYAEFQGKVVPVSAIVGELATKTQELQSLKKELLVSCTEGTLQYQGMELTPDNMLNIILNQQAELHKMEMQKEEQEKAFNSFRESTLAQISKTEALKKANERLKKQMKKSNDGLAPFLHQQQKEILTRRSTRGMKWDSELIREGLILKLACGTRGYTKLVQRMPLYPSVRCLQSSVQFVVFASGMLPEMFDLIELAFQNKSEWERYCQLVVDEMAIQPGEHFDHSTKKFVGKATFPSHDGIATKGLVILLAGILRRWKLTVAVYLTNHKKDPSSKGRNTDNATGKAYKEILDTTVIRAEKSGALVVGVTSDMGPDNLAYWREYGIDAGRSKETKSTFVNPARPSAVIRVLPDGIHLFKAIKTMMENNGVIYLPEEIVKTENLPSNEIHYKHLDDLYFYEENCELKVAFRLKPELLHTKQHFRKMAVTTPRAVICHRSSVGLNLMSAETGDASYQTTAWFLELLNTFFELVTARHKGMAVSKHRPEVYDKVISHIKTVAYVFKHMKVGAKGEWKPCQRGMLVLCDGLLGLIDYFLCDVGCHYLMLARFLSDCIENVFACLRAAQALPHAVAFFQNLKVYTLAQYSEVVKGSSYDHDEMEALPGIDILEVARQKAKERINAKFYESLDELLSYPVPKLSSQDLRKINTWEQNVIYDMAGYIVKRLKSSRVKICDVCFEALLWKGEDSHPRSAVVHAKEFTNLREDGDSRLLQIFVSDEVFIAILTAEVTFRMVRDKAKNLDHSNVEAFLVENLMYIWTNTSIPNCHSICRKLLQLFVKDRIQQFASKTTYELNKKNKAIDLSSKSMAKSGCVNRISL